MVRHSIAHLSTSPKLTVIQGPIAVPLSSLPNYKSLRLITRVNGELRQDSNLTQLIFSIPTLLATISSAITVQPGDVIATGTPAGVGIGRNPPVFLKPGDTVTISVAGLGTLRNTVAAANSSLAGIRRIPAPHSAERGLTRLATSGKLVHIERFGHPSAVDLTIFIHGLGGSTHFYRPAIIAGGPANRMDSGAFLVEGQLLLYDLEGHGLSPTAPESQVSIASYTADLRDLILTLGLEGSRISFVAHSLGCLIALGYHTNFRDETIFGCFELLSLPSVPLSVAAQGKLYERAETVRIQGMLSVVDDIVTEVTSPQTRAKRALKVAYVRAILTNTNPEGYAKGCTALAATQTGMVDVASWFDDVLVHCFVGAEDTVTPPDYVRDISGRLGFEYKQLEEMGHWCVVDRVQGPSKHSDVAPGTLI